MTDTDSQQPLSNAQLNALRNRLGLHGRRYIRSAAKDLANETEQDSAAAVSPPEPLENLVEVTEIVEPEVDLDAIDFSDQLGLWLPMDILLKRTRWKDTRDRGLKKNKKLFVTKEVHINGKTGTYVALNPNLTKHPCLVDLLPVFASKETLSTEALIKRNEDLYFEREVGQHLALGENPLPVGPFVTRRALSRGHGYKGFVKIAGLPSNPKETDLKKLRLALKATERKKFSDGSGVFRVSEDQIGDLSTKYMRLEQLVQGVRTVSSPTVVTNQAITRAVSDYIVPLEGKTKEGEVDRFTWVRLAEYDAPGKNPSSRKGITRLDVIGAMLTLRDRSFTEDKIVEGFKGERVLYFRQALHTALKSTEKGQMGNLKVAPSVGDFVSRGILADYKNPAFVEHVGFGGGLAEVSTSLLESKMQQIASHGFLLSRKDLENLSRTYFTLHDLSKEVSTIKETRGISKPYRLAIKSYCDYNNEGFVSLKPYDGNHSQDRTDILHAMLLLKKRKLAYTKEQLPEVRANAEANAVADAKREQFYGADTAFSFFDVPPELNWGLVKRVLGPAAREAKVNIDLIARKHRGRDLEPLLKTPAIKTFYANIDAGDTQKYMKPGKR